MMKAQVIKQFGDPSVFELADVPKPALKPGHVHTPVEMVCIEDIDHTIQLIYALLQKIDPENVNLQDTFD